ncbi:HipA N-terminal domain-containing protein [Pseudomonas taiwanensis]|uniref:HipA N-terminal domain-containing protein n=1 Tax=Pseudomonas taiwanensis TaxID=470150 RepID=UPI0028DE1E7B|nr:HipA N-terminal domain-containing protein [Pseudomonas taiwanensis]MDT8924621.1 HipA N-terminal domain-containing protein [Pseudomonas taiwanensis]
MLLPFTLNGLIPNVNGYAIEAGDFCITWVQCLREESDIDAQHSPIVAIHRPTGHPFDQGCIVNGIPLTPGFVGALEAEFNGSTKRPVQWFFDNLLPEEQARTLLAGDAKIEFADAFGLLGYYGAEPMGLCRCSFP